MDLTDRQRKFAFVGVIAVLAVVGIYLTLPASSETAPTPSHVQPSASTAEPVTPPPGITTAITPDNFDIYRLLPFQKVDFANAADLAQRFTAAYGTYSFKDDPQAHAKRLRPMVTADLGTQLAVSDSAPGLITQRQQDQEIAQATASIDGIRSIGSTSLIFLVTGRQQDTKAGVTSQNSQQYAVTVSRSGASWEVYAFAPAGTGQPGDTSATR